MYIFWQWSDQVYHVKTDNNLTSRHLRLELTSDLYVIDEDLQWTYVLPHSGDGPIWYLKE